MRPVTRGDGRAVSAAEAGTRASLSERVLVLVLGARNGKVTHELLLRGGIEAFVCSSVEELCIEIEKGGAAALIAEEALTADAVARLSKILNRQPAWSDFPIVVFGAGTDAARAPTPRDPSRARPG